MSKRDRRYRTQSEAADALGISAQAVGQLARSEGAPTEMVDGKLRLLWPQFPRWRDARRDRPAGALDAQRRKEIAEAEITEIKLARLRGELMTLATYETAMTIVLGRLNARIGTFAARLASRIMAVTPEGERA